MPEEFSNGMIAKMRESLAKNPEATIRFDHRYGKGGYGEKRSREILEPMCGPTGVYTKITHGQPTQGLPAIKAGKEFVIRAEFKIRDVLDHIDNKPPQYRTGEGDI